MALITNANATWQSASATTTVETWQCRTGGVLLSVEASPAATDGIYLAKGQTLIVAATRTVKYRLGAGHQAAVISREAI